MMKGKTLPMHPCTHDETPSTLPPREEVGEWIAE